MIRNLPGQERHSRKLAQHVQRNGGWEGRDTFGEGQASVTKMFKCGKKRAKELAKVDGNELK